MAFLTEYSRMLSNAPTEGIFEPPCPSQLLLVETLRIPKSIDVDLSIVSSYFHLMPLLMQGLVAACICANDCSTGPGVENMHCDHCGQGCSC